MEELCPVIPPDLLFIAMDRPRLAPECFREPAQWIDDVWMDESGSTESVRHMCCTLLGKSWDYSFYVAE